MSLHIMTKGWSPPWFWGFWFLGLTYAINFCDYSVCIWQSWKFSASEIMWVNVKKKLLTKKTILGQAALKE
jgi:hypothetical protein